MNRRLGEPVEHQTQEPDRLLGRRAMPPPFATVVGRVAVQRDEHRQSPGLHGERETDEHGEHDPRVAVPPGRERVPICFTHQLNQLFNRA
jgi:hypothetical protein